MDCIVYCRISKFQGQGDAPGVDDQEADGIKEAQRRGWTVLEVIRDSDESAFEGNYRPGYARLVQLLETGAAQAVVARDGSRVHRDLAEYLVWEKLARRKKITTAFYKGGDFELQSASGRMSARIINVISQAYSETIQENVNRAMERRAIQGLPANAAKRAYGYEPGNVRVRPAEAALLRQGAADLLAGRASIREVARRTGLTHRGLKGALLSPRMIGMREYGGQLYGGVIEPILDDDTWAALQVMLGTPQAPRNSGKRAHLLSGLARCQSCEGRLSVDSNPRAYRCRNDGCGLKVYRTADALEAYVRQVVLEAISELGERPAPALEENAQVIADLRRLDDRLREVEDKMADPNAGSLDMLMRAADAMNRKKAELQERVAQFQAMPELPGAWPWGERMEEWEAWWHHKDRTLAERQAVIESQVSHVLVMPTQHGRPFDRASVRLMPK